jgi:hypothetical protein
VQKLWILTVAACMSEPPPEAELAPDVSPLIACPVSPVYSPYTAPGHYPSGPVSNDPWVGATSSYPDGDEDFSGYGTALPITVECSDDKGAQDHLDVTDGCLLAVRDGAKTVGKIVAAADGAFRAVALGYVAGDAVHPLKWTDEAISYRFLYKQQVGTLNNPGFKAFVRYRSEDDLYVASWRTDGVVQIQKKQCGVYTALAVLPSFGAPTANKWHTMRFSAIGQQLELALDGHDVLSATSSVFSWGTNGLRIDAMNGALIDDWTVSPP